MQHRTNFFVSCLPIALALLLLSQNSMAQAFQPKMKSIYHKGWIDLNKNGVMDIYEDPSQPTEKRIDDILSKMTLEEKSCQMATLYGYHRVLKDSLPTPEWKNKIWKDGIANIDEHLNGFIGWGVPTPDLAIIKDIKKHVWAMNTTQAFFIEDTRLGIPVDFTDEGIRGVEAYGTTDFPTQLALGNTWDKDLVYKVGKITGEEGRAMGYTNVYAPILDVARDQRWGRLEESYGEAPYLVERLGVEMSKGMQKDHTVVSTAKHYALYSANFGAREGLARTDPQIPLREAYTLLLPPFEKVIKEAGIMGVMASYNDYDGIPIIGSYFWLTKKLRQEFGFNGYIVSDSDALEYLFNKHHVAKDQEDAVAQAVNAGLDVRTNFSPPETMILPLRKDVLDGKISEETLNQRVREVLRVKFWLGLFDHPYIEDAEKSVKTVNDPEHKEVSLQASRECIVLLKNDRFPGQENNILPLNKNLRSIAVIGPNANDASYAGTHYGPQGVKGITVFQGIKEKLGKNVSVNYAKGCEIVDSHWPESEVLPQPPSAVEEAQMDSAVDLAKNSDVVIMVMGGSIKTAGENKSRTTLDLPGYQLDLMKKVQATGKPVVVVFINSQPISFNWVKENIPGIVEAWYPGQFGGKAVADVLFGDYNPGGKLTLTFPRSVGQLPMNFPSKPNAQTDEGESARLKGKLYPFGYGLSYTTFSYSSLKITPEKQNSQGNISVSFDVKNTGAREGDEVVQMYTHEEVTSVTTYEKNLRGFDRVHLKAGETKTISFALTPDDLSIWNRDMHFVVEPGTFKVMIGASSEDIKLNGTFEVLPVE
jgi:beta-glucosidase